jgi:hypothetical protein
MMLQLANAVCEVQSRCALLVAGSVDRPELVTKEKLTPTFGACEVCYNGWSACKIDAEPNALGWTITVRWMRAFEHLAS